MYVIFHYYGKIKIDTYDCLPLEKTLTLHNIAIHIKSVLNKNQNDYYSQPTILRNYNVINT